MVKKKLKLKKNIFYKLILSTIFLLVMIVLFTSSYFIYTTNRKIPYYTKDSQNYSYLEIEEMSESFARIGKKELHFVRDKKNIYVIAINKKDQKKYQEMIDYTYEKSKEKKKLKIFGYPIEKNTQIKNLEIKYINKFLSYEEKIEINENNYQTYLANTYLDTTINSFYKFNYIVFILLLLLAIVTYLFIKVIFFKGSEKISERI